MKYRFFTLAAVALTLTLSCGKEEPTDGSSGRPTDGETDIPEVLPPLNEGEIAFRAFGEFFYNEDSNDTDGVMSCFEDGTMASVFAAGDEAPMEVQAVNTQTNAYFVVPAEVSKTYYAVYPSSVIHHFESGEQNVSMSVTIPQEQDGSLSSASISVARSTGEDARMDFLNICGLLKFSTISQNIKSVTFRGADNEDLIGTVSVGGFDPETGEPIFGGISQTYKEVKLNIEGHKGVFYVALLPGLTLENGFLASFEMMPQTENLEEAVSGYSMTLTRSGCIDIGNILDYIPQLNWFVTETGGSQVQDGKSWETAISGEQMFHMIACNRPEESGSGNMSTDITSTANKENFADYLEIHNTKHVQQLDGVTFHIAQGEYSSQNYVRVSFPELERKVRFTLCGGYAPDCVGKDLSARDIERYPTVFKAPSGSGTARMFFFQRWLDMTVDGLTFTGGMGDSGIGGGAILLNETSTSSILFKDCTFIKNNSASFGGAVIGSNDVGQISFVRCDFSGNNAVKSGGAVCINGGTWSFMDCTFSGNKGSAGDSFGGAVYAKNASLTCTRCTFSENSSVNNGGAVWLNAMSKADFTDCDFISNVCTKNLAGAICLSGANPLNITGGTFKGNSAPEGGCFYNNAASTITITGTKFIENVATTGVGGVFYCNSNAGAVINIENAEFTGNTAAKEGGALCCKAGAWNIAGTTFDGNIAGNHGGALHSTGSTTVFVIDGSIMRNNSVTGSAAGGVIYSNATTTGNTVSNTKFESNSTQTNGGALYFSGNGTFAFDKCQFDGNYAKTQGAVIKQTAGTVYFNASSFTSNVASGERTGGVMRLEGGQAFLNNCCFYGNQTTIAHSDIVVCTGTTTVLNSTLYESDKTMACVRVYNAGAVANLYNNVLLNPNSSSNEGTVRVGYWANPGSITSPGYNYTTEWKALVDSGVNGSITMADTDKVVVYANVSGDYTATSATDGRGYYTWSKPTYVTGTTSANVTAFLNGITGGSDFATWLGTVDGLTKDIAGNNRPATGWYPGCYQGN